MFQHASCPCQSSICLSVARSLDTASDKNRGGHLVRLPFVVSSKGSKVSQSRRASLSSFDASSFGQYGSERTCLAAFQTDLIIFTSLFHLVTLAGLCFCLYQRSVLIYSSLSKTWTSFFDESQSYQVENQLLSGQMPGLRCFYCLSNLQRKQNI